MLGLEKGDLACGDAALAFAAPALTAGQERYFDLPPQAPDESSASPA